jgi:hypothetical protein
MLKERPMEEVSPRSYIDFFALALANTKNEKFDISNYKWSEVVRGFVQELENTQPEVKRMLKPVSDAVSLTRAEDTIPQVDEFLQVMRKSQLMPCVSYIGGEGYYCLSSEARDGILDLYQDDFTFTADAINRLANLIDTQLSVPNS